ncbi:phosphatase PAP2 family protein [Kribbella sp. NPDC056861]|uniref:phosphatase PAP2 family protein n=1 Tax=Kribbella sp. NPDC056861 TaxID=3154857 RepID=UPI003414587A
MISFRRWPLTAGAAALAAVAVYLLAVWTAPGQELENAVLRGADESYNRSEALTADDALAQITVYSLAAACLLIAVVALVRRRLDLMIAAVGVIVGGQVVTQSLKRFILVRPDLVEVVGHYKGNSLPSGHTTIAMTVLFAALIVVPYRWRGLTLFFVLPWATGIGAYTMAAKWHRLSDTLAADAIALALACCASWWLARRGVVRERVGRRYVPRVIFVVLVCIGAAVSLALGALLWIVPIAQEGLHTSTRDNTWTLYLGGTSLATAGSAITALIFWATWRRLEAEAPAEQQAEVAA